MLLRGWRIRDKIRHLRLDLSLLKMFSLRFSSKILKIWLNRCWKVLWLNNSVKKGLTWSRRRNHPQRNLHRHLLLLHLILEWHRGLVGLITRCLIQVAKGILNTQSFVKIKSCSRVMGLMVNHLQSVESMNLSYLILLKYDHIKINNTTPKWWQLLQTSQLNTITLMEIPIQKELINHEKVFKIL